MSNKIRIAVLVSGGGTNLQALIDAERSGKIKNGEIALVICNRKSAYAIERARNAGIRGEIVTRKAYGGAYIAMCSKHLGADFVYAWPKTEIAVMGAEGALGILYAKEMKDPTQAALVAQKSQEYKETVMTPDVAAKRDYISEIINPEDTRERVARSLEFLEGKSQSNIPLRKHGNIPL